MRTYLYVLTGLWVLASCGALTESASESSVATAPPTGAAVAAVRSQPFSPDLIRPGMTYVGTLVHGLAWTDGQGEQVAIFSREMEEEEGEFFSSSVTLHVYHYRLTPAGVSLVREVKDFTLDCEFDNMAAFVPEAMGLTDLDQDGEAELTFAYYLGCTSDVSPLPFKLLLLESGSKYIIRGDVVPPMMGESSQVPDPAFAAGPAIFLEHAQQLWNKTARYPGL